MAALAGPAGDLGGIYCCRLHENARTAAHFRRTLPLRPADEIVLPADNSRFGYASFDPQRGLLFVAHVVANFGATEVLEIDVRAGRVVPTIPSANPTTKEFRMLSWDVIAYGAAVSALAAAVLAAFAGRERRPTVLVCAALGALLGAVAWNAILHATHADQFFHDAPIAVFPISWQDTGSGVFVVAVTAVLLGFGPMRADPGRRIAVLATLAGLAALLVDIYLY